LNSIMYELRTSGGFSSPIRHFRPLKALQVTESKLFMLIVVRAHAGEPPLFSMTWRLSYTSRVRVRF